MSAENGIPDGLEKKRKETRKRLDMLNAKRSTHKHGITCLLRCPFKNIETQAKIIEKSILDCDAVVAGIKAGDYAAAIDLLDRHQLRSGTTDRETIGEVAGSMPKLRHRSKA